jgi:predicted ArsR family transcriptional regulator
VSARPDLAAQVESLALLVDRTRRAIFLHAASSPVEVSRDEAAAAVGVSRKLAVFHLEKLVDAGLLEPVYRRLTGRSGPGAGRPAKLYRRSSRRFEVSLPARRYELAARILVEALQTAGEPDLEPVRRTAREVGIGIGRSLWTRAGPRPAQERLRSEMLRTLTEFGFQPLRDDGLVRLRNCPFEALARDHRSLICDMNLALLTGLRDGSRTTSLIPELDPVPGCCCVVFRRNYERRATGAASAE